MSGEEEQIDWIDEAGTTLAVLPRPEIHTRNLLHRATATLVFHSDGRFFVHQRADSKRLLPGFHDVMVCGTVASGESFEENAGRELAEELGISGVDYYHLFDHRFQDTLINTSIRVFACQYDGPMIFQPEEVQGGEWMTPQGVEALIARGVLCPDSAQGWRIFRERFGEGSTLERLLKDHGLKPVEDQSQSGSD